MLESDKQKLKDLHDASDLDFLEYFLSIVDDEEDKKLIERLIYLNNDLGVGWGEGDFTPEDEEEYFVKKEMLIRRHNMMSYFE